jgi:hypothetical protein
VEYLEARPEVTPEQREQARQHFEQERTDELLNDCVWGDGEAVRLLLSRGCPVDSRDYDGGRLICYLFIFRGKGNKLTVMWQV